MYFPLTESEQKFISNIFSQYVIANQMNKKAKHYWTGTGTSCIYTSRLFSVVDIFVIIVVSALP